MPFAFLKLPSVLRIPAKMGAYASTRVIMWRHVNAPKPFRVSCANCPTHAFPSHVKTVGCARSRLMDSDAPALPALLAQIVKPTQPPHVLPAFVRMEVLAPLSMAPPNANVLNSLRVNNYLKSHL